MSVRRRRPSAAAANPSASQAAAAGRVPSAATAGRPLDFQQETRAPVRQQQQPTGNRGTVPRRPVEQGASAAARWENALFH